MPPAPKLAEGRLASSMNTQLVGPQFKGGGMKRVEAGLTSFESGGHSHRINGLQLGKGFGQLLQLLVVFGNS